MLSLCACFLFQILPDWTNGTQLMRVWHSGALSANGANNTVYSYNDCRHGENGQPAGPQCYSPPVVIDANYINLFQPYSTNLYVLIVYILNCAPSARHHGSPGLPWVAMPATNQQRPYLYRLPSVMSDDRLVKT